MALGQAFDIKSDTGVDEATVTIDGVHVDPTCSADASDTKPNNGHFVAVHLLVQTAPTQDNQFGYPVGFDFLPAGPDGLSKQQVVGSNDCLPSSWTQFNNSLVPSTKVDGWVIVDAPADSGTMVYRPHWLTSQAGWRFSYEGSSGAAAPAATTAAETTADPPQTAEQQAATQQQSSGPSLGDACIGADIGKMATSSDGSPIICGSDYKWDTNTGQTPNDPWVARQDTTTTDAPTP